MALLAIDVMAAGAAAEKEFKILELSQDAATVLKLARNAYIQGGEKAMRTEYTVERHDKLFGTVFNSFERLPAKFEANGIDPATLEPLRRALKRLDAFLRGMVEQGHQGNPNNRERMTFVYRSLDCFKAFLKAVQLLHISSSEYDFDTALGLDPRQVLLASALLNVLLIVLVAMFVERKITSPVRRLIDNCSYLEKSEPMPEPKSSDKTEIGVLEQSFYRMSLELSQNELGRRNYLEMLKTVQSASLISVLNLVTELKKSAASGSRLEKSYNAFTKGLNNLLELLKSMTEGLSNAKQEIKPNLQLVNVSSLVEEAAFTVDPLLKSRNIKLKIESLEKSLKVDPALIARVLNNFLSNAIKYSNDGSEIILRIENSSDNSGVRFSVCDSGPGISAEGIAKLFKKFSQLEAADGVKRAGTGLGLAICKDIVEAHKGEVACTSEVGKGSTFWFRLPEDPDAVASTAASPVIVPGNKKRSLPGSIKRKFLLMLAVYLSMQFAIDIGLNAKFTEAERKTRQYAIKKEISFQTHEMLGMFLIWSRRMLIGMNQMNFNFVRRNLHLLERQINGADWVLEHTHKAPALEKKIENVHSNLSRFHKLISKVLENPKMNMMAIAFIYNKTYKMVVNTDQDLFDSLELEKSDVDASYAWALEMRDALISILIFSGVLNLILLAFTARNALKITGNLTQLSAKAEEIAKGAQPVPTIMEKDELGFLDLRLTQVSMELKRAEQERQDLMATINHDLRTPVNSILSGFELMLAGAYGNIEPEQLKVAASANNKLMGLVEQINNLLLIEKIDSGTYVFERSEIDLCSLLETAQAQLGPIAEEKGVSSTEEIAESCRLLTVWADQALLGQLIKELLKNAIQHSSPGSQIKIRLSSADGQILLSICNKAVIHADLLEQIFERFRSAEGKPLVGLGLPLAERISKLHGYKISIDSNIESGTTVSLQIPLEENRSANSTVVY